MLSVSAGGRLGLTAGISRTWLQVDTTRSLRCRHIGRTWLQVDSSVLCGSLCGRWGKAWRPVIFYILIHMIAVSLFPVVKQAHREMNKQKYLK